MVKKASQLIEGMSPSLADNLLDKPVVVTGVTIRQRQMRGNEATFVEVTAYLEGAKPETASRYHAWSASLAEKLGQLSDADLAEGVALTFKRVSTGSGFKVLTIE